MAENNGTAPHQSNIRACCKYKRPQCGPEDAQCPRIEVQKVNRGPPDWRLSVRPAGRPCTDLTRQQDNLNERYRISGKCFTILRLVRYSANSDV